MKKLTKTATRIQQACKGEVSLDDVRNKIVTVRNQNVLLDSDVAWLYGVATNDVNQAVKRNSEKFPAGYVLELNKDEKAEVATICGNLKVIENFDNLPKQEVATNCDNLRKIKFSPALPKAFTEKGLYMLATILKSERAVATTLAIVEAFAKLRELSTAVAELVRSPADAQKQALVTQKSGEVLSELVTKELRTIGTETTYEFNLLSAIKIKHVVKKEVK